MLSDREIKLELEVGNLKIEPFFPDTIRENGLDLHLAGEYAILRANDPNKVVDLSDPDVNWAEMQGPVVLQPKEFALVRTIEYIKLGPTLVGSCNLRSTVARWGILAPPTIVDAGFEGQLVIEIFNTNNFPVRIKPGVRFLHLTLQRLSVPSTAYKGTYQGQKGLRTPKPLK